MNSEKLTVGEKRVRVDFNVSGDSAIDLIKRKTAELINLCENVRNDAYSLTYDTDDVAKQQKQNEMLRLAALAQTHYEQAAMWAVKAITT